MTRIAVFGLGEAGALIAADLAAAGHEVHGYDPAAVATPVGVVRSDEPTSAASAAAIVLAVTAAADATAAFEQAVDGYGPGMVYADLSTGPASLKQDLARRAAECGVLFADVAMMTTVPGHGVRVPSLVSGSGATAFGDILGPVGMPIEIAGSEPGHAATRKLLRSVVMKGVAALLIESMRAAEAAGLAEETWANLVHQFDVTDEEFLRRLIDGTPVHAVRRRHEMEAARQMLTDLGVDPVMTVATVESLRRYEM